MFLGTLTIPQLETSVLDISEKSENRAFFIGSVIFLYVEENTQSLLDVLPP